MKSFKYIFLIIATQATFQANIIANQAVITFFVKEKLHQKKPKNSEHKFISPSLHQPSFVHAAGKDRSWLNQLGVDGLQASYLGYSCLSDSNGQIVFPRNQQSDTIYLLITPDMQAEFMMYPTLIHHWVPIKNQPAALYEMTHKKNEKLSVYYFETKKLDIKDYQASLHDLHNIIVLYAHPDHIDVPIGISLSNYSSNLILPELQAHKVDIVKNSLYTLPIKQYFEPIDRENKHDKLNIASMIFNQ